MVRHPPTHAPPLAHLAAPQRAILQFIAEWNETAHPFRWTTNSFETFLPKIDAAISARAPALDPAA